MKSGLCKLLLGILIYLTVMQIGIATTQSDELKKAYGQYKTLYGEGNYKEAIKFARIALDLTEKQVGPNQPEVADILNDLGVLYESLGRNVEAEPLFKRSRLINELTIFVEQGGPDHPLVAMALSKLAELYKSQGRYAEAGPLYEKALPIYEKALGANHQGVAMVLSKLAEIYESQGRYAKAGPLYEKALPIYEKVLGANHQGVAMVLNKLAELYRSQGRYAKAEPLYERARFIFDKALGPDHPKMALVLNNVANLYIGQGRYAKAEPLYERALLIYEKALGRDHLVVAPVLSNLAHLCHSQGRYAEAEPLYKRSIKITEKALGPDHSSVARILNNLAALYQSQGRYAEVETLYGRSIAINKKALGPDHPDMVMVLNNLAELYRYQGRYAEAEPLYEQALKISENALGPDHPKMALVLNNLAALYQSQGRYAEVETLYGRSRLIIKKALGPDHPDMVMVLNNLAELYRSQGRYAEAEPLFEQALKISEKALGSDHPQVASVLYNLADLDYSQGRYAKAESRHKRSLAIIKKALGPDHPSIAKGLNSLANLYKIQGRYPEVEALYRRSIAINKKAFGPKHPDVATGLNNLGALYKSQRQYDEAEPLFEEALSIHAKALGPNHPAVAVGLNNMANLYKSQQRYTEAESFLVQSLLIREKAFGPNHPDVATGLNNLGALYKSQRQYDEAEPFYERSLKITENALGRDHPQVALVLSNLAHLYKSQRLWEKSFLLQKKATTLLRRRRDAVSISKSVGADAENKNSSIYFSEHASAAFLVAKSDPSQAEALHEEAFEVIQLAQVSSAGSAFAQMTARFGSDNDALAKTVRSQQDLLRQWRALDKQLIGALSKPNDKRNKERETRLLNNIDKTNSKLDAVNKELNEEFPQYIELANPKPLKVPAVQKLLEADEALVLYKDRFVWVVTKDKFRMLDLNVKDLEKAVTEIRKTFELSDGAPPIFPKAVAHDLYKKIFAPIEPELTNINRVLVIPNGPLTSLPLSVLVRSGVNSEKPEWLAEKYAFTTLPSVSSLRALRTFAKDIQAEKPFIGFGDPVFSGTEGSNRGLSKQEPVVPPLPETAGELKMISAALGNTLDTIYLGNEATETRIKTIPLDQYRVVAFATHGLIAGERPGLREPALLFTAPEKNTKVDNGELTASEVAQLKMNAEWVLLSACNTAAGNSPNAEGLSGLAKAFFYAGSKSLLVSHWTVHSIATTELITGMFDMIKKNDTIGKAEALRQSMLNLIDTKQYSHPAYWAPFTIVGDGN